MIFLNKKMGVFEKTENPFLIEQFLQNSDNYEVVEEKEEKKKQTKK